MKPENKSEDGTSVGIEPKDEKDEEEGMLQRTFPRNSKVLLDCNG